LPTLIANKQTNKPTNKRQTDLPAEECNRDKETNTAIIPLHSFFMNILQIEDILHK